MTEQFAYKVSVCVPIYNVEKYLGECLDSIINQTLKDIEIICVNDGSTDNSLNILKEYAQKDNRIKIIDKTNSGYGASMNMALNSAKGEYIGVIESDDFAQKDMFETLYNLAKENDADIAKSDWYKYWSKNKFVKKENRISPAKAGYVTNFEKDNSLVRINPSVWSGIYKREFLDDNNIRFLETPGASYQDLSFTFKLFTLAKRVILTDKAYLYYRQDNINSSVKAKNKIYCVCDEYDEIERFMNEHPEFTQQHRTQEEILRYTGYMSSVVRLSEELRPEFVKVFSEYFKKSYESGILNEEFFSKVNKKEFLVLINDQKKFLQLVKKRKFRQKFNEIRKKLITVHIRSGYLNITIFGKEIISCKLY